MDRQEFDALDYMRRRIYDYIMDTGKPPENLTIPRWVFAELYVDGRLGLKVYTHSSRIYEYEGVTLHLEDCEVSEPKVPVAWRRRGMGCWLYVDGSNKPNAPYDWEPLYDE